jgi:hypothetical protein
MLKKNLPNLQDLALNIICTRNSPTPAFLHKPVLEILCLPKEKQTETANLYWYKHWNGQNSNSLKGLEKTITIEN